MTRISPAEPPYEPAIAAELERIMPPGVPPLVLFRTMAKSPRIFAKMFAGGLLDKGPLALRQREILIDRTTARLGCEYEWGVHVATFAKAAHLTDEQIRATVRDGAAAPCWSESEQALIAAVDALHVSATLSDEEFKALATHYDDAKIFEIILLCGFYRTVSYLANGLDLPLEANAARFPK